MKFKSLQMIAIFGVITACNQPQSKDEPVADNAVSLTDATLEGDELIKTNFGDIELIQSYITKESIAKLNDQLSVQRAIEVYQWSLPVTTFQMWYNAHSEI